LLAEGRNQGQLARLQENEHNARDQRRGRAGRAKGHGNRPRAPPKRNLHPVQRTGWVSPGGFLRLRRLLSHEGPEPHGGRAPGRNGMAPSREARARRATPAAPEHATPTAETPPTRTRTSSDTHKRTHTHPRTITRAQTRTHAHTHTNTTAQPTGSPRTPGRESRHRPTGCPTPDGSSPECRRDLSWGGSVVRARAATHRAVGQGERRRRETDAETGRRGPAQTHARAGTAHPNSGTVNPPLKSEGGGQQERAVRNAPPPQAHLRQK